MVSTQCIPLAPVPNSGAIPYEAPTVASEPFREPVCPALIISFQVRLGALGLTLHLHPYQRSVWNVFDDDAGWVGQLRLNDGYRVLDHTGTMTWHSGLLGALAVLIDAAATRVRLWEDD